MICAVSMGQNDSAVFEVLGDKGRATVRPSRELQNAYR